MLLPMFTQTVYTVQYSTVQHCTELDLSAWRDAFKRRHSHRHLTHLDTARHTHMGRIQHRYCIRLVMGNRLGDYYSILCIILFNIHAILFNICVLREVGWLVDVANIGYNDNETFLKSLYFALNSMYVSTL